MGTVATQDALVTGGLEVQGERARLVSNVSVTAYERTAEIALSRGGQALVCATSAFHLLHAGTGQALLFGLDRGALELHTASYKQDVILTPDLRFTVEAPGWYDLRIRVTGNGDTCVENVGKGPPVLLLNDAFTLDSYRVMPGQHVLFEHGSLHEVVDNERSACGCQAPAGPVKLARTSPAAQAAAEQHPFPAAESAGLARTQPVNNSAPAGETHTQISTTMTYGGASQSSADTPAEAVPAPPPATPVATDPPPSPPGAHSIFHAIGRFFHKLFHAGS